MSETIASLSIAAHATLNMHSLNNEGGEGNQIQTRMVDIVGSDGQLHNVNAISGDMLKRVLMEHFYQQARAHKLALCQGCQGFNPNRITADTEFTKRAATEKWSDGRLINELLNACAIDDVAGILVTEGRSTPRKSVSEFGWVLGLPGRVRTNSYFHVKYALERGEEARKVDAQEQKGGANRGQSIFHRPASSGVYALVCHLELARVGYNDITQRYAIGDNERRVRASLLLESLLHTFIELNGAMRSTQLPHLVALEGIITLSRGVQPAPLVSPLLEGGEGRSGYIEQTEEIVVALNGGGEPQVESRRFATIGEFANAMRTLVDACTPFELLDGR